MVLETQNSGERGQEKFCAKAVGIQVVMFHAMLDDTCAMRKKELQYSTMDFILVLCQVMSRKTRKRANIIKENPNIKPSEIQSARVLSAFRRGEDWQSVRKKVESTMDKQCLANIKKKVKRDMEPVGHDYEAVITFKQYCDNNDTFYVYKVNDNRGNPDMPSFVFKMGAEKAKMAINMDRDGEHYLRDEFCFFDGKRKRCQGFVTLTASAYHPLLRKQVPLAITEATAEDTPNIKLFWSLFNEVLQKVKRDDNYKFRRVGWCSDMAGPNMAAICDVFGSEATQYIKTCEFHFKDHRNQKSRKLDQDSSECFKQEKPQGALTPPLFSLPLGSKIYYGQVKVGDLSYLLRACDDNINQDTTCPITLF